VPNEQKRPSLDPDEARERLDEVEEHIQAARRQVHEDLEAHEDEPTFASSGETPEADDQTIAPPG
jgi:hypothetical protein